VRSTSLACRIEPPWFGGTALDAEGAREIELLLRLAHGFQRSRNPLKKDPTKPPRRSSERRRSFLPSTGYETRRHANDQQSEQFVSMFSIVYGGYQENPV
jgi:hypothetical protein